MLMNTDAVSRVGRRWSLWPLAALALGWAVLVLSFYYRQIWRLASGQGWETVYLNTGPSTRAFVGMLIALAVGLVLVSAASYRRGRYTRLLYIAAFLFLALAYLGLTWASAMFAIDPALPFFRHAMRVHLVGAAVAAALFLAAVTLGLGISRALGWRYDHWREGLAFGGALGIGAFANLGLLLALAGLYRPPVLGGIVALVLLGGFIALAVQVRTKVRRDGLHLRAPRLPHGATGLWIACGALALLAAGIAALAPESQFDAVWWHLPYPQRYLATGHLVDLPSDFVSLYPMTGELWFGYGLAFGGAAAAILLHYGCLLLSAVATWQMARRFAPAASPALAVALMLTVPTVVWEASTAYVDLFMMLFITLSFYALMRYVDGQKPQWLVLAALNLGFALASKHLALFALALFCPGLLLALRLRKASWRMALLSAVALGALSVLVVLPWYVRSYLATGNPVFETMYAFFGAPPERWNAQTDASLRRFLAMFGRPRTLLNTLTLPWHMTVHASSYDGTLGPLFLILLPLLILRPMRRALPWLIGFVTLFVLLWASPLASFELRHLMPITPVLGVLGASGFARGAALARAAVSRRAPALLSCALAVLMVLNLPPFTFLHEGDRVEWDGWLTSVLHTLPLGVVIGGESADTYLSRQIASYGVWQFAEAALPADARVLTWSEGDQFYTHHDRVWANSALAIGTAWAKAGHEEEALAGLRRMGITHLIVDKRPLDGPNGWNVYALTGPLARTDWYEQVYEDYSFVLYRIRWESLGEP